MFEVFRQLRWHDLLDILIVAYLIYRVLLIIRGTRAVQMIIGIFLLLLAYLVSDRLQLNTLYWIVQSFWAEIVLALVIIFQPEIRKALARMGQTTLFKNLTPAAEIKSIDEIVRASVSLANRKIGALIVLERNVSLDEIVEIGTPLDARVSRELILSIFHPSSPIHDGAIIVRGERIIAAGCFLPITFRTDISRTLGTRHRAALGLTEESDAIVIVVSEETGKISVAHHGRLESNMDMNGLLQFFTKVFAERESYVMEKVNEKSF